MPSKEKATNMTEQKSIGILGGTFDPIHMGHTIPSEYLAKKLNLNTVYLLPAHIPPHKQSTSVSASHRLQMVGQVCANHPLFTLDARELKRTTKSFTIDSIKELKLEQPNSTIYFFIGTDSLLTLPTWYQIEEILSLCHFVVSSRPGYQLPESRTDTKNNSNNDFYHGRLTTEVADLKSVNCGKILIIDTPKVNISSTELREKLKQQQCCADYIDPFVYQYIKQQGLYL